jgi:hypothetical protein
VVVWISQQSQLTMDGARVRHLHQQQSQQLKVLQLLQAMDGVAQPHPVMKIGGLPEIPEVLALRMTTGKKYHYK